MTKRIMQKLAFLLSIVMVVSLFANLDFAVFADADDKIDETSYDGNNDCFLTTESEVLAFGSIRVPSGYHLTIAGVSVTASTVTIEDGGCIHILNAEENNEQIGSLAITTENGLSVENGANIQCAGNQNIPTVNGNQIDVYDGDSRINDDNAWGWYTFFYAADETKWYLDGGNQGFEGLNIHAKGATVQYKVDNGTYSNNIQSNEHGDAVINRSEYENQNPSTITLKFTAGNAQTIYGIEIRYNDGTNEISMRKSLNENGEYTLDAQYSYEIDVIDWECPMDNQYRIIDVGLDTRSTTVTVGETSQNFGQMYGFTTGNVISLTVSEDVYGVYAGDAPFSYNNGVYTYTPSSDTGFDIFIYASEAWYNYDHAQPGEGQFAVEYQVRRADESDTSSVSCFSPTPVQQVTADDMTKLILDSNVTSVSLTISPSTGYHYEVSLDGSDVTSAVNNNVYSWEVDPESWDNPRPEIRFIADEQTSYDIEVDFNPAFGSISEAGTLPTGISKSGSRPIKYTVPKDTTGTLRLNIIPESGYTIDELTKDGSTVQWSVDNDNVAYYEFNLSELTANVSMNIEFKSSGTTDPGEGGEDDNPGQPQDPKVAIPEHEYAYYVNQSNAEDAKTTFKKYLATEIWWEFFNPGRPFSGQYDISTTANDGITNLQSKITLEDKSAVKDSAANLYYYSYQVTISAETAENPAVVVTGKAYILDNNKQFIVKTGEKYNVVEITTYQNEGHTFANDIQVKGSGEVKVFGNGTCTVGSLEADSENTKGWHVTQEHSGLGDDTVIGRLGCRLIVCTDEFTGVSIKGDRDAAAWNFGNVSIYDTGTQSAPAIADVYYGADTLTMDAIDFANQSGEASVTGVSVDTSKLPAGAVNITLTGSVYKIDFNTGYDSIPLKVQYSNGETGYVTINRVGLNIAAADVSGSKFDAWHGTDHTVKYNTQNTASGKAIYATFYYQGDTAPTKRVSLFTTVTTSSGVERKVIDAPITSNGTMVGGGNLGYASQGTDRYYDDFLIWSGTDAEYNALQKVEAIVYDAGSSDSFGGVKVGSGTGVVWTK